MLLIDNDGDNMKERLLLIIGFLLAFGFIIFFANASKVIEVMAIGERDDTDEVKKIIDTIEKAYELDYEVAYKLKTKKMSTVYINDPRFEMTPGVLQTIREMTGNLSLESAGYLDYKIAYFGWMGDSILHEESVYAKAKSENRDLTEEEKASLTDEYGRSAPTRIKSPIRTNTTQVLSVDIKDDIAIAVVNEGEWLVEFYLVLVDNKWYIADKMFYSGSQ